MIDVARTAIVALRISYADLESFVDLHPSFRDFVQMLPCVG